MDNKHSVNQPSWTLTEAILILLVITILQLGTTTLALKQAGGVLSLFGSGLWDVMLYGGIIYLYVRYKSNDVWTLLGLRPVKLLPSVLKGVFTGVIVSVLVLAAGYIVAKLQGWAPYQIQPVQEIGKSAVTPGEILLFILTTVVLVPLKEEIIFRAFLFPALRERVGSIWGILATSLLFSLSHGDLGRSIPLLIAGIGLCILYHRTGSLYSAIIAHGVWNGIMSLFLFWG